MAVAWPRYLLGGWDVVGDIDFSKDLCQLSEACHGTVDCSGDSCLGCFRASIVYDLMKFHQLEQSDGCVAPCPEAEALSPQAENADGRVFLFGVGGELTAHAALWWRETPLIDGRHIGAIRCGIPDPLALLVIGHAAGRWRFDIGCGEGTAGTLGSSCPDVRHVAIR